MISHNVIGDSDRRKGPLHLCIVCRPHRPRRAPPPRHVRLNAHPVERMAALATADAQSVRGEGGGASIMLIHDRLRRALAVRARADDQSARRVRESARLMSPSKGIDIGAALWRRTMSQRRRCRARARTSVRNGFLIT